jgi:hypothetical protein
VNYVDTAEVLIYFDAMKKFDPELYSRNLEWLIGVQDPDSHGWSRSPTDGPQLKSTIWVSNAVGGSKEKKLQGSFDLAMGYILEKMSNPVLLEELSTDEWALALKLAAYLDLHITHERDLELQEIARNVVDEVFRKSDLNRLEGLLGEEFKHLKRPIAKAARVSKGKNKIEKWADMTPRWLKILLAVILTLVSLVFSLLALR